MTKMIAKARLILCAMMVVAFFLPAYNGYSAFRFLPLSLSAAADRSGVTTTDILILDLPLLLLPVTAAGFCLLFVFRIAVRPVYLILPLVFLLFFLTILFRSPGIAADGGGFRGLQIGFYLMALSVVALPFTKNAKKKSRKRIRRSATKVQPAA